MDITQPTRKKRELKPKLIEMYNTFNWGGFGRMRMLVIFQSDLAAERNHLLFLHPFPNLCLPIHKRTDARIKTSTLSHEAGVE